MGLRLSILYDDSVYKHWKSVFTGTSFAKRNEAKKKSKDEDEYRKIVGKANVVMTNYGSTILKEIVNGNKAYLLNEIEEKDLTNAQKYEWNIIGEKIFCWTCCLKPQRAWFFRFLVWH